MVLSAVHDKLEDIPEQYQDLYTEKNGQYELTGVAGIKTQADVDRVTTALQKERDDHKATKTTLQVWTNIGIDADEVQTKLDKFPELEAAAQGKLDDNAIEEIVNRRVEGTIKSQVAPLERQIRTLTEDNEKLTEANNGFLAADRRRTIHDNVRDAMTKAKVIPEAHEDALMLAERVFEIREDDGAIVTKDNVGITPGLTSDHWLTEMQDKRPHWWPGSQGGGAGGSGSGGSGGMASNPWSHDNWNMTEQGRYLQEHGTEKATAMARAAGTTIGGMKPAPKAA